ALEVTISGNGTVSPNLNGKMLMVGKSYTMTARPSAGSVFVNWTGSSSSSSPVLMFVMQSNLVFQANFAPKQSGPGTVNATFNGLFFDPNDITPQNAGSVNLIMTSTRNFTGKLQLGSARLSLKGQFDTDGNATVTVARPMKSPLSVVLHVDLA